MQQEMMMISCMHLVTATDVDFELTALQITLDPQNEGIMMEISGEMFFNSMIHDWLE
jgi:hypothetical protein